MGHNQQPPLAGSAKSDLSLFAFRMIRIVKCNRQCVAKDGRRLIEGYAVFPEIPLCLGVIPFKLHLKILALQTTGV